MADLTPRDSFDLVLNLIKRESRINGDAAHNENVDLLSKQTIDLVDLSSSYDPVTGLVHRPSQCYIEPIPGKGFKYRRRVNYRRLDMTEIWGDTIKALDVPNAVMLSDLLPKFEALTGITIKPYEIYDEEIEYPVDGSVPTVVIRIRTDVSLAWIGELVVLVGPSQDLGIDLADVIKNVELDGLKMIQPEDNGKTSAEIFSFDTDSSVIKPYLITLNVGDILDEEELRDEVLKAFPDYAWVVSEQLVDFNLNGATVEYAGVNDESVPNNNLAYKNVVSIRLSDDYSKNLTGCLNLYYN